MSTYLTISTIDLIDSIKIDLPIYPYTSKIIMPFDIQDLDNGDIFIRDEGRTYDKRYCEANFILTPQQQYDLNQFIAYDHRGEQFLLDLPSSQSGFYPFGPDLGNVGTFPVACVIVGTPRINYSPYKHFTCSLQFALVGTPPAFSLPTQINDGSLSFAGINNLLLPQNLFEPDQTYAMDLQLTENSTPQYINHGIYGDCIKTNFELLMTTNKAAAIIYAMTNTYRATGIPLNPPSPSYALGADHGDTDTYTMNNTSNTIEIKHEDYNRHTMKVSLHQL